MKRLRSIQFSRQALILINLFAIVYNAALYLFTTNYIIAKGLSHALLEELDGIPNAPTTIFFTSVGLYGMLLLAMSYRDRHPNQLSVYDKVTILEIFLMIGICVALHFSYNGIVLLVFADIFYGSREFHTSRDRRYWLFFIILSFTILLLSNYDLFSLFVNLPSLNTYISFYPEAVRIIILFFKNFLTSLNIVVFIISLISYIMYAITERHNIEEELRMVSKVNTELNSYLALSEKIVQDRERKRIAREIHDTLGHALTGISAGIDAVRVLVDIDPERAKTQLQSMSIVVRDGIRDVRGSLNKLRPGALQDQTLKDALLKIIKEYEDVSNIHIFLKYEWDEVDLDIMREDVIFRVIQESITNSVRHGHASQITIEMLNQDKCMMTIQDNGIGFENLNYGYGLKQIKERLSIIGGTVHFENRNGFYTSIEIPKVEGERND